MFKNLAVWLVIGLVLMTVFNQFNTRQVAQAPMEYSQFLEEAKAGKITRATIDGRMLRATTQEGRSITVYTPGVQDIWMVSDLMRYTKGAIPFLQMIVVKNTVVFQNGESWSRGLPAS